MKAAILFFGQPRVVTSYNYNLVSLNRYKDSNRDVIFDTYAHHWTVPEGVDYHYSCWSVYSSVRGTSGIEDYVLDNYRPKKHLFEEQRDFSPDAYLHPDTKHCGMSQLDISNMISQIHSVAAVCNLVENPGQYKWFILLRTDCEISEGFPLLRDLEEKALHLHSDFIQVFGFEVLEIYRNLVGIIREVPLREEYLSAERLRFDPVQRQGIEFIHDLERYSFLLRSIKSTDCFIDVLLTEPMYRAWVNPLGTYCRRTGDGEFICKFYPGTDQKIEFRAGRDCIITVATQLLGSCLEEQKTETLECKTGETVRLVQVNDEKTMALKIHVEHKD